MSIEWATETVELAHAKPGRGTAAVCTGDIGDVTSAATAKDGAVNFAINKLGRLDVLLNNVGIARARAMAV